jgi:hypothetical protein
MNDISHYFDIMASKNDSVISISIPENPTMINGKWKLMSRAYQFMRSNEHLLNNDKWADRFSTRGCELFSSLKDQGIEILRFEVYLSRQKFNLYSNYKERSSADCKFLQSALRYEYGFDELPSNMMPMGELEAIVGALLAERKVKEETKNIFEFKGLDVINLK